MNSTKPRILITGSESLLAKYLTAQLMSNYELILTYHQSQPKKKQQDITHFPLDITNSQHVKNLIEKVKPVLVVHLAAISNIDYCEIHKQEAQKVNILGTKNICDNVPSHIGLIFISSSMVFSGIQAPYSETDHPSPINVYGWTKFEGEKMVMQNRLLWTIIRLNTLFGWPPKKSRENDLNRYLTLLKKSKEIHLVDNLFYNPIYALRAAEALEKIISEKYRGIFHIAGRDRITRYDFVKNLIKVFKIPRPAKLIKITSDHFTENAPRPRDVTLSITKMEKKLKIISPSLSEELEQVRKEVTSM